MNDMELIEQVIRFLEEKNLENKFYEIIRIKMYRGRRVV